MWELGKNEPDIKTLLKLSEIFGYSVDEIITGKNFDNNGMIPQGIPFYSAFTEACTVQDAQGFVPMPRKLSHSSNNYIGIIAPDKSMFPLIREKELVIFERKDACFNGQLAAVTVGKAPCVIRRVFFRSGGILLQCGNLDSESAFYNENEIQKLPVNIIGVAVCSVKEIHY